MAQATRDPSSFRNNVMLKQEGSGMGFYGYVPLGRRHLLYHGLWPGRHDARSGGLSADSSVPVAESACSAQGSPES